MNFYALFCICLAQVLLTQAKLITSPEVKQLNTTDVVQPRILGGVPISISTAPWQVSVRLKNLERLGWGVGHICGGSVISTRVVLTAAHCVARDYSSPTTYRTPDEFTLVMGSIYLYQPTQNTLQYDVLVWTISPGFNITTMVNDLALFFMSGAIPRNYPTVQPIALNTIAEQNNTLCEISGWGLTAANGQLSSMLHFTAIPIITNEVCNQYLGNITAGMLCAARYSTGGICRGDGGGPLVCNNYLAGIASWGDSCNKNSYPGVFTNVLYYNNWIKSANTTYDYHYFPSNGGNGNKIALENFKRLTVGVLVMLGAALIF